MLVNISKNRLVFGRITVLPGDKVAAVPLTTEERKAVEDLRKKGILEERTSPHAPQKAEDKPQEKTVEKPAEKPKAEAVQPQQPEIRKKAKPE